MNGMYIAVTTDTFKEISTINFNITNKGDRK